MTVNSVQIASISWIDEENLPAVGFWRFADPAFKWAWENRVIIGLVATANARPPTQLKSVETFARGKQYRALLALTVQLKPVVSLSGITLDPGYTPPFDKRRIHTKLVDLAIGRGDILVTTKFSPGENSSISGTSVGKLHACSTLSTEQGDRVIASALIKFRAGNDTDTIGVEKAGSPVHVPWVWCEFALVKGTPGYRLLCSGSVFPSHAWYVNGRQCASQRQAALTVSSHDPILTTGQPATQKTPLLADPDRSSGPLSSHMYAVGSGRQIKVQLPSLDG